MRGAIDHRGSHRRRHSPQASGLPRPVVKRDPGPCRSCTDGIVASWPPRVCDACDGTGEAS